MISRTGKLDVPEREVPLWDDDDGRRVWLTAIGEDQSIKESERLALMGQGFSSEEEARDVAEHWRGVLERSWAAVRIAADFGGRAPRGGISLAFKEGLESKFGGQVLNDRHGLIVYECEPSPVFIGMSAAGLAVVAGKSWLRAFAAAEEVGPLDERSRLAYDIFSAAFFVASSPDARFMLLMMALETLIDQEQRTGEARDHVDRLVRCTKEADLEPDEKQSILGSLNWLKMESISHAGRRLADSQGDWKYSGLTPRQLFTEAYALRPRRGIAVVTPSTALSSPDAALAAQLNSSRPHEPSDSGCHPNLEALDGTVEPGRRVR